MAQIPPGSDSPGFDDSDEVFISDESWTLDPAQQDRPVPVQPSDDESVDVGGNPLEITPGRDAEPTRRELALVLVASFAALCGLGLLAVTFSDADPQGVALILSPFATLVTAAVTYYFFRGQK